MPAAANPTPPPVVVVGAGPVGMALGVALAQAGVEVVVVEATPVPATDWRASTFHPPTLALLAELGVIEQMHAEGLPVPKYQFRDRRDGVVAEFDFTPLADETPYPYRLQLNQQHLVRMLLERGEQLPALTVRFGTRATAVHQDETGVDVEVQTTGGAEALRASYLVGADGAASTVRNCLGIDFDGYTYAERFLIVSTPVDMRELLPDIADVNYIADPDEWLFLLRTPESWRAVYPLPPEQGGEQATDPAELQRHLQGIAAFPPGYPIENFQVYSVHQRVAAAFRSGRAMLVGDAAHINSPLGGVGLNSGIHDAIDLARRVVRVRHDGADADDEFDRFAALRRRIALEYVQADTARNTERLAERDPARREEHYAEMRGIAADPDRARAWCRRASLLESVQRFGIGRPPSAEDLVTAAAEVPALGVVELT